MFRTTNGAFGAVERMSKSLTEAALNYSDEESESEEFLFLLFYVIRSYDRYFCGTKNLAISRRVEESSLQRFADFYSSLDAPVEVLEEKVRHLQVKLENRYFQYLECRSVYQDDVMPGNKGTAVYLCLLFIAGKRNGWSDEYVVELNGRDVSLEESDALPDLMDMTLHVEYFLNSLSRLKPKKQIKKAKPLCA